MATNNDLSMIVKVNLYTLKYDEKNEGLRDKTYSELIKEHGHGKIKCSCMNRVYDISSQFVKSHFETQKHKNWLTESQKEYIKNFGHCCSQQDIINLLNKELRELKCNITHLTNKNKALAQENIKLEAINRRLKDQISEGEGEGEGEIFMECNL
jgi:septal ring factor EnvC (AmiA/AmiB activator)